MVESGNVTDPVEATDADTCDVYACYDDQELERATEVLEEAGIEALTRDPTSSAFPLTTGTQGRKVVAVFLRDEVAARGRLKDAQEDGILTEDGIVLGVA